jgi:hypothetical protein
VFTKTAAGGSESITVTMVGATGTPNVIVREYAVPEGAAGGLLWGVTQTATTASTPNATITAPAATGGNANQSLVIAGLALRPDPTPRQPTSWTGVGGTTQYLNAANTTNYLHLASASAVIADGSVGTSVTANYPSGDHTSLIVLVASMP